MPLGGGNHDPQPTARETHVALPVICVGNFSVGGTAKPQYQLLYDQLTARTKPQFLSAVMVVQLGNHCGYHSLHDAKEAVMKR